MMKQFLKHRKHSSVLVVQIILAACFIVSIFLAKNAASKFDPKDQNSFSKIAVMSLEDSEQVDWLDDDDLKFFPVLAEFSFLIPAIFIYFGIFSPKANNNTYQRLKYYTLYCCQKIHCTFHT